MPALFFLLDRAAGWGLQELVRESHFRYSRLYRGEAEAEILLIGNSRGLMFFQPRIEALTGKSTFNLSYNGLPLDLANELVADYLDRYPAPGIALLEVTIADRFNPQLVREFQPYRKYSPRLSALIQQSVPRSWYGGSISHLYRYNSEVFWRALSYLDKSDEDWLMQRSMNTELQNRVGGTEEIIYENQPGILQAMTALIQRLEKAGTRVHLLVNPYYPPYIRRMTSYPEWRKRLERELERPVLDYAQAISRPECFGDYLHLNQNGAKEYMNLLFTEGLFKQSGN